MRSVNDCRIKTMFGSSLPPVVCRRARLIYDVRFVFTSSCLKESSCLIYDVRFVFTSSCLKEGSCLINDVRFVFTSSCL